MQLNCYGLTKSADLENVTLYRYDKNQKNLISKNLNLRLAEIKILHLSLVIELL